VPDVCTTIFRPSGETSGSVCPSHGICVTGVSIMRVRLTITLLSSMTTVRVPSLATSDVSESRSLVESRWLSQPTELAHAAAPKTNRAAA
jgi:hypothetical protein